MYTLSLMNKAYTYFVYNKQCYDWDGEPYYHNCQVCHKTELTTTNEISDLQLDFFW